MSAKYDLFPAFVVFSAESETLNIEEMSSAPAYPKNSIQYDKARVLVMGGNVTIAIDSETGPKIIFRQPYEEANFIRSKSNKEDSRLTTTNGTMLVFKKNDACGCGSRLRSWNPYRTLGSSKDPA